MFTKHLMRKFFNILSSFFLYLQNENGVIHKWSLKLLKFSFFLMYQIFVRRSIDSSKQSYQTSVWRILANNPRASVDHMIFVFTFRKKEVVDSRFNEAWNIRLEKRLKFILILRDLMYAITCATLTFAVLWI